MRLRRFARYPWAAMSHLTPNKFDVFFRPNSGMREFSDSIARNVSILIYFHEKKYYLKISKTLQKLSFRKRNGLN